MKQKQNSLSFNVLLLVFQILNFIFSHYLFSLYLTFAEKKGVQNRKRGVCERERERAGVSVVGCGGEKGSVRGERDGVITSEREEHQGETVRIFVASRWWSPRYIPLSLGLLPPLSFISKLHGVVFIDAKSGSPLALVESGPQDQTGLILAVDLSSAFAADVWAGFSVGFAPLLIRIDLGPVRNSFPPSRGRPR